MTMKQRDGAFVFIPSPLRLCLTVLTIVFLSEAATMFLLPVLLPGVHTAAMSIADASMLIVLSAPFLWWFVVRPLRKKRAARAPTRGGICGPEAP